MRRLLIHLGMMVGLAGTVAKGADLAAPLELRDGDRVVLLGSALIERDGESGYLETRLARRYPGRGIVFRNLGWTGDTVDGITRGKPNPPTDGFRKLIEHVTALQPTVIILGYGANESFGGLAGFPAFGASLDRLWSALAGTGARVVVLTPTRQENLGAPLPDPTAHNADLARYGAIFRSEAARRGAICVDLFDLLPDGTTAHPPHPWTTNGVHLSPAGYWQVSSLIAPALAGPPVSPWSVAVVEGKPVAVGTTLTRFEASPTGVRFHLVDDLLPDPPRPEGGVAPVEASSRSLRVAGLAPGRYRLTVDGQAVALAEAKGWQKGVPVVTGPEVAQVEALRVEINRKNRLYFHRWRPQNETYLFGFRKHEQGQNAAELAAFDPLIGAAEAEIVRLGRPVSHTYELVRVPDGEVAR